MKIEFQVLELMELKVISWKIYMIIECFLDKLKDLTSKWKYIRIPTLCQLIVTNIVK